MSLTPLSAKRQTGRNSISSDIISYNISESEVIVCGHGDVHNKLSLHSSIASSTAPSYDCPCDVISDQILTSLVINDRIIFEYSFIIRIIN